MQNETEAREAAEKKLKKLKKCAREDRALKLIPKPKGSCGRHYKLPQAMLLSPGEDDDWDDEEIEEKQRTYLNCRVSHYIAFSTAIPCLLLWNKGWCSQYCYCWTVGLAERSEESEH